LIFYLLDPKTAEAARDSQSVHNYPAGSFSRWPLQSDECVSATPQRSWLGSSTATRSSYRSQLVWVRSAVSGNVAQTHTSPSKLPKLTSNWVRLIYFEGGAAKIMLTNFLTSLATRRRVSEHPHVKADLQSAQRERHWLTGPCRKGRQ